MMLDREGEWVIRISLLSISLQLAASVIALPVIVFVSPGGQKCEQQFLGLD